MNERDFRTRIVQAFNGTGLVGNDRQFWSTLLTAINGTETYAQTENEFRDKLVEAIENYSPALPGNQAVVEDGDEFPATGGTVVISVTGNTVSAEFVPD